MEAEKKAFMGMTKANVAVFIIAEFVHEDDDGSGLITVKNLVRKFEGVAENVGKQVVVYQAQPDPFFSDDVESRLNTNDFLTWRMAGQEDEQARDFFNFLTRYRARKSGLVLDKGSVNQTLEALKK